MIVRQANHSDLRTICELYEAGLKEIGETKIIKSFVLNKVITSHALAPCFLLIINDTIVGIAGLTLVTTSHSGDVMLADYMFYIKPKYRSLENLGELVNKTKEFALQKKLPLRLDFIIKNDEPVKRRMLEMFGFKSCVAVGIYNE